MCCLWKEAQIRMDAALSFWNDGFSVNESVGRRKIWTSRQAGSLFLEIRSAQRKRPQATLVKFRSWRVANQ